MKFLKKYWYVFLGIVLVILSSRKSSYKDNSVEIYGEEDISDLTHTLQEAKSAREKVEEASHKKINTEVPKNLLEKINGN